MVHTKWKVTALKRKIALDGQTLDIVNQASRDPLKIMRKLVKLISLDHFGVELIEDRISGLNFIHF